VNQHIHFRQEALNNGFPLRRLNIHGDAALASVQAGVRQALTPMPWSEGTCQIAFAWALNLDNVSTMIG
jgi:hypothetical protein